MLGVQRRVLPLAIAAVALAAAPLGAQRRTAVITSEEIEGARPAVGTAFDAVRSLRPQWLRARDLTLTTNRDMPVEVPPLRVYLDGREVGDLEYLKTISTEIVQELRFLSANEAASRFGPTSGPVIAVTLKRPPPGR